LRLVRGLAAGCGGQALDHLSVICPWVLASVGGMKQRAMTDLGMLVAN